MFQLEKLFSSAARAGTTGRGKKKNGDAGFLADPIKISLVLAAVIILIMYIIFKDSIDEDESIFGIMIKASLLTVVTVVGFVFMHNKSVKTFYEDKYKDKSADETVARATQRSDEDIDVDSLSAQSGKVGKVGKGEKSEHASSGAPIINVNVSTNSGESTADKPGAFKSSNEK